MAIREEVYERVRRDKENYGSTWYISSFNNFTLNLLLGLSPNVTRTPKFEGDIRKAIVESGFTIEDVIKLLHEIEEAMNKKRSIGLAHDRMLYVGNERKIKDLEGRLDKAYDKMVNVLSKVNEELMPIYVKLREMGYSDRNLCG